MARLNVTAIGDPSFGATVSASIAAIAVAVTNSAGVAVTGLTSGNFVLASQLYPPGGGPSTVALFYNGPLPGTYTLYLQPAASGWRTGRYTFALRVYSIADFETIVFYLDIP